MAARRSGRERGRFELPRAVGLGRGFAPFQDLYHFVLTRAWWQFFGLCGVLFLVANLAFALLYWLVPGSIANAPHGDFGDAFFFSVESMATIGYGSMGPGNLYAHVVVTLEAFVGIVVTALVTGLTFAKFSVPRANVLFTERGVIAPRDGVPTLMFRMANARHNGILEAQLRIVVLRTERTREGDVMRRPVELELVRRMTPLFALSWTAMHVIDASSPFFGDGLARLREERAEIILTLIGLDDTISQTVHARYRYAIEDIVQNARFADVLTVQPDGTRILDYRRFHDVEPLPAPSSTLAPGQGPA